ncbi:MAG: prepilin-type N-terminal cleavage/methylation domain-containing protein [Legionella sp.]|nr:prepilin-type N-terminal cleavage/methylation domain-containing protein [Legionella sp.]
MIHQKGFSLIEVLLTLMLVSTLALSLFKEQQQHRQLLNQFILQTGATLWLDDIQERSLIHSTKIPDLPQPYHLRITQVTHGRVLEIDYFQNKDPIKRTIWQLTNPSQFLEEGPAP